jgi:hypothetical protein
MEAIAPVAWRHPSLGKAPGKTPRQNKAEGPPYPIPSSFFIRNEAERPSSAGLQPFDFVK